MLTIGVVMSTCGSILLNVGQNMQSASRERAWLQKYAVLLMILGGTLNFAALNYAPSSILTPIESVQLVCNILIAKFVFGHALPSRIWLGTLLILLGVVFAVLYGPKDSNDTGDAAPDPFEVARQGWTSTHYRLYFSMTLLLGYAVMFAWMQRNTTMPKRPVIKLRFERRAKRRAPSGET